MAVFTVIASLFVASTASIGSFLLVTLMMTNRHPGKMNGPRSTDLKVGVICGAAVGAAIIGGSYAFVW